MVRLTDMDSGEWLDRWLATKQATPKTLEKYALAVRTLKESLASIEIEEITVAVAERVGKEDPALRSVLSMALAQAVKANLIGSNVAAVKREQRKPQEGSLYYRPNRKAWMAQVTFISPDGRPIKRTRLIKVDRKTKNPPEEAVRALEELKALKTGGGMLKGSSTIEELMNEWLASIRVKGPNQSDGLARATFAQYESLTRRQVIPMLGKIKAKDLTRSRVDRWLRDLESSHYTSPNGKSVDYSANTLRLCRVVLGMALKWAIREGVVARNVARESLPAGGRPQPEKHAMTEEQAAQLIDSSRGTPLGTLWALMIVTGLRRGEALGLRWQDFDGESITVTSQIKLEGGKIARGDLKTDKSRRRIRLPGFLVRDLETHRELQRATTEKNGGVLSELIFTNSKGGPIRPDNLRDRFISACKRAGIASHEDGKPWGVHELRHTAASQLLNDRVPMQIVSRILGHSSITVTLDVYSHLTDQDSELVADSMNNRYDKDTRPEK